MRTYAYMVSRHDKTLTKTHESTIKFARQVWDWLSRHRNVDEPLENLDRKLIIDGIKCSGREDERTVDNWLTKFELCGIIKHGVYTDPFKDMTPDEMCELVAINEVIFDKPNHALREEVFRKIDALKAHDNVCDELGVHTIEEILDGPVFKKE